MNRKIDPHKDFEKHHSKKHAGYVLITCDPPGEDGEMKVEMTFGGSACLAHMLIDGAHASLESTVHDEEDELSENLLGQ